MFCPFPHVLASQASNLSFNEKVIVRKREKKRRRSCFGFIWDFWCGERRKERREKGQREEEEKKIILNMRIRV